MLRLTPSPDPRPSAASVVRALLRAIGQLLLDALRLGAVLGLFYLLGVAAGLFR